METKVFSMIQQDYQTFGFMQSEIFFCKNAITQVYLSEKGISPFKKTRDVAIFPSFTEFGLFLLVKLRYICLEILIRGGFWWCRAFLLKISCRADQYSCIWGKKNKNPKIRPESFWRRRVQNWPSIWKDVIIHKWKNYQSEIFILPEHYPSRFHCNRWKLRYQKVQSNVPIKWVKKDARRGVLHRKTKSTRRERERRLISHTANHMFVID